jgi:hypothetical protein
LAKNDKKFKNNDKTLVNKGKNAIFVALNININ